MDEHINKVINLLTNYPYFPWYILPQPTNILLWRTNFFVYCSQGLERFQVSQGASVLGRPSFCHVDADNNKKQYLNMMDSLLRSSYQPGIISPPSLFSQVLQVEQLSEIGQAVVQKQVRQLDKMQLARAIIVRWLHDQPAMNIDTSIYL